MNEILSEFKRLKIRCPNCGRRLQTTPSCEEWCEDCLWENGRKKGYCIIKFPDLIPRKGYKKKGDNSNWDTILFEPSEFDEIKHPAKNMDITIIENKDCYNKLSKRAKEIIHIILSTPDELLSVAYSQCNNKNYNLIKRIISTYMLHNIGMHRKNKILKELKEFVKSF